jgi:hypothetical protein
MSSIFPQGIGTINPIYITKYREFIEFLFKQYPHIFDPTKSAKCLLDDFFQYFFQNPSINAITDEGIETICESLKMLHELHKDKINYKEICEDKDFLYLRKFRSFNNEKRTQLITIFTEFMHKRTDMHPFYADFYSHLEKSKLANKNQSQSILDVLQYVYNRDIQGMVTTDIILDQDQPKINISGNRKNQLLLMAVLVLSAYIAYEQKVRQILRKKWNSFIRALMIK